MEQDGGWRSARKSINKSLLKNIIRHTDAHNKIQEQNEMWKQWELKKQKQDQQLHRHDRTRGYMRSDIELSSAAKEESLKWNRLLLEYEETRNDRWGHSGYKELYPDEFRHESTSDIESDQSETKKDVRIKSESSNGKRKKKKEKKVRKSRKVKSDSDDSDVETCRSTKATNTKSKGLGNDLKTANNEMKRKVELKNSKMKRVDEKERSKDRYIDNDLKSRDRKRKLKSDSRMNDVRRYRKRKSECDITDRDVRIKRKNGKRSTEGTIRKHSRTVENNYSSKTKRKSKHPE